MARLLLLSGSPGASSDVLPALGLLAHRVRVLPLAPVGASEQEGYEAVLVDATREPAAARSTARALRLSGTSLPVLAVLTEGSLVALDAQWQVDDFVLATGSPAEVQARIVLATSAAPEPAPATRITAGGLVIDEEAYSARLHGRALDLTYKEFELLKYLAQHPGRVLSRAQLLQDVWGYDYFGGTRTVDVHVRRLRAKLGPEHDTLISTVRNVGYRFAREPDGPPG